MDAPIWDVTVFTKNRERLLEGDVARKFMAAVLSQPRVTALLSNEHFSVDGTLIDAWASMKGFRPKDGSGEPPGPGRNGERSFHGEQRSNETHASTSDPEARLYRKGDGQASRLAFMGHVLMENRNGLLVAARLTPASGTAEREAALDMIDHGRRRVTPHVAVDGHVTPTGKRRRTALDRRTLRHAGYALSQRLRQRIEEPFGWIKTTAGLRKTCHRGAARVGWMFTLAASAYNLIRLPKLLGAAA